MYLNGKKLNDLIYLSGERFTHLPSKIKIPSGTKYYGTLSDLSFDSNERVFEEDKVFNVKGIVKTSTYYQGVYYKAYIFNLGEDEQHYNLWYVRADSVQPIGGVNNPTIYLYLPAMEVA